jgi:hypothetical protein
MMLALLAPLLVLAQAATPTVERRAADSTAAPANPAANPIFSRIDVAPVGGGFAMEGYWVWGSSVARGDDGLFHMFVSRWPQKLPFHPGWLVASEIVHATAKTIEGPYEFRDVVLPARGPQFWDGRSTHNPKIVRRGNEWVLFYMGSTHPFADVADPQTLTLDSPYTTVARSNKRIGVAVAKSPFGPWVRRDAPVLATKPDTFYSFLTSNPAPFIEKNGRTVLVFKGRSHKQSFPFHGDMSIGVARAPHYLGPYTVEPEPIFAVDRVGEVEDPFIWKDKTGFHMLAKDQRGGITGEKHAGLLAHSRDGVKWTVDPAPKAYSKAVSWSDGKTFTMGQLERAFGFIDNGALTHLFFATMDGSGGFRNGRRSWNMVVRLKPAN